MAGDVLRIHDPRAVVEVEAGNLAPRRSLSGGTVVFFDNGKPNVRRLMAAIAERFASEGIQVEQRGKPIAALAASDAELKAVAAKAVAVVNGVGD